MALIDLPTRDLLTAFSSSDPTPGGGSAAGARVGGRHLAPDDGRGAAEDPIGL
jgi:hypothetical protein